jgi:peptidylamidoglycolate lyase
MFNRRLFSRRSLLTGTTASFAAAGLGTLDKTLTTFDSKKSQTTNDGCDGEVLGQAPFRYRAHRHWGVLDRAHYPVKDCHGITEDRNGRIILLTNDTHNNLVAYDKGGKFLLAWEKRFPTAHGLEVEDHQGEDRYWITDHDVQCVSVCTADGRELRRTGPDALASKYSDLKQYHPTNSAFMPEGDFYVSDGYGSSYVHHFDPAGRYISSFGGTGNAPSNLNTPHAVWIDTRSGKPSLLVCDRGNEMLKWFSLSGELQQVVPVPGAQPSNVTPLGGSRSARFKNHIAVASLNGMILILDGTQRVVSVVGGEPPVYVDGKLLPLQVFNYTFNHPHDVYVDSAGALYVAQWWSGQTYPIKLVPLS